MAEVSKTGDAVGRGSWRSSFLGAPGAELFAGNFSAQKFLETGRRRPVPRFPVASGRPKENSSYGKCAQENCLTLGVHPTTEFAYADLTFPAFFPGTRARP